MSLFVAITTEFAGTLVASIIYMGFIVFTSIEILIILLSILSSQLQQRVAQ